MAKPGKTHVGILFSFALVGFLCLGIGIQRSVVALDDIEEGLKQIQILAKVMVLIQDEYVNAEKTSTEELINGAIHGMVEQLDKYSSYMEKEEAREFNDQTQGSFGGLGIQIEVMDGWLTVVEPLPNTPAAKADLMSGDKIVLINGESTKGMNIMEAIKRLKGEPGTDVTISIARKGEQKLLQKTITRAIIQTSAVQKSEKKMLHSGIGYVRLRDFTRDAADELKNAIKELQGQGMKGLILDIRDNVGGLLDVAVDVCDLFVDRGQLVVSHKNTQGDAKEYKADSKPIGDFLLAVLVNEFSASASEIVAGCIQDHNRGVIVGPMGKRTFGKGSVQTLFELPILKGGSLKLTTAKYYTPSGRSIEDDGGLLPDIFAPVTEDERIAIRRANKVGHLPEELLTGNTKKEEEKTVEKAVKADEKENDEEISIDEIFADMKEEPQEEDNNLYDVELYTAYQALKGAVVIKFGKGEQFSLANPGN